MNPDDGECSSGGGIEMRRGWAIVAAILVSLAVVGIAIGAYNAGIDEGIRRGADAGQVVEVVNGRYGYGHGFFPFGFFLFPLFLIGTFLLIGWAFGAGAGDGVTTTGPATGPGRTRACRFEERAGDWHRRQHEQASGGGETDRPAGWAEDREHADGRWRLPPPVRVGRLAAAEGNGHDDGAGGRGRARDRARRARLPPARRLRGDRGRRRRLGRRERPEREARPAGARPRAPGNGTASTSPARSAGGPRRRS